MWFLPPRNSHHIYLATLAIREDQDLSLMMGDTLSVGKYCLAIWRLIVPSLLGSRFCLLCNWSILQTLQQLLYTFWDDHTIYVHNYIGAGSYCAQLVMAKNRLWISHYSTLWRFNMSVDIKNIVLLILLNLSLGTDSLKHSWACLSHHSWVKINILKTSAVSLIRDSVLWTNWWQLTTELTKPYWHIEGIAWLVIWKPYNCNWDGTYCDRFLVLIEDLRVVILRMYATSGNMAFWGD
jgi:hypothetical protein